MIFFELLSLVLVVAASAAYLKIDGNRSLPPQETTYENAKAALDRMKDWTSWLTGLQTAAIGAMALLAKGDKGFLPLSRTQQVIGFLAILFLGASVVLSTWILSSLPSVQQRLEHRATSRGSKENDIYAMKLFTIVDIRIGRFTGLYHLYCLLGITFFGAFVCSMVTTSGSEPDRPSQLVGEFHLVRK